MKRFSINAKACAAGLVCGSFWLATPALRAGDNKAAVTETEEEAPKNWIEFGIGGLSISGDDAQFKQEHHRSGDVFGGISDAHYEKEMGKGTLTIDGHALFEAHDYDFRIDFTQQGVGYIRGGYTESRTWYDGNGGYFPGTGLWIPPANPEDALDRGEAWIELGLRVPKWPEITLHYSHIFRDGRKDSTIWGDSTLTFLPTNPSRKLAPAFRDIDESRDIFSLEVLHSFEKTDVGLGMYYERSDVDNRLQLERGAGQLPPLVAAPGAQRFITQRDKNEAETFNGHVTVETRPTDTLWLTAAYSYTTLDSDISGTRIIGADYDSLYTDPILTLQSNDHGTLNLAGMAQTHEHIGNFNIMWVPLKNLSAIAGFRYTHEEKDAFSTFLDTNTTANVAPFTPTNPQGGFHRVPTPTRVAADSSDEFDNVAETFELRYNGVENWVFYARGDWTEESGNVREHELSGVNDQGMLNKDTELFAQKYTAGINWYPMVGLNFATQYYHKTMEYDNDFKTDLLAPPNPGAERNQRLLNQEWDTDNFNIRMTWRPTLPQKAGTISLVTRYDYQRANIDGQWSISPLAPPGNGSNGTILDEIRSGIITQHIFSESITWNPCPRFYVQSDLSYVQNETDTPADIINVSTTMPSIVDSQNDYWTARVAMGYVVNEKTDLHAEYSYYRADNYEGTGVVGMPYGMGATQHTVGASVTREIRRNVRLKLQYGYYHYRDETSGGHNNYDAHAVFSSLQFRF